MKSTNNTSAAFSVMSWLALTAGVVVYLIGLWRSDMALNEQGYYFAVLILALFSSISLQKTVRDRMEELPTTQVYYLSCVGSFTASVTSLLHIVCTTQGIEDINIIKVERAQTSTFLSNVLK